MKTTVNDILLANGLPKLVEIIGKKAIHDEFGGFITGIGFGEYSLAGKPKEIEFTVAVRGMHSMKGVAIQFDPKTLRFKNPLQISIV